MITAHPSQREQGSCSDDERPPETFNGPIDGATHTELIATANQKSTFIHRLPLELIAYIFEIYVNSHNSHDLKAALLLGAVSLEWRRISQSYPRLWDRFCFILTPKTTEAQIQLTIEWFNRSGALPLSVTLSVLTRKKERLIFPLIDVINRSLTRCRSLSLSQFSSWTLSRFTPMQGPNMLENLELRYVASVPSFNLGLQAAPTKLSIDGVNLNTLAINWTNLTHFRASGLYVSDIVESLILAPQMKVCQQYRVLSRDFRPLDSVIMHSQLEFLEYKASANGDINIGDFFENITLPNLIEFRVKTQIFPVTAFRHFVARSSCAIKTLSIDSLAISGTGLIELAKILPSITSLTLSKSDYDLESAPSLEPFYNALCMDSRYADSADDDVLLPSLQHLSIQTWRPFPWKWLPGIYNRYRCKGETFTTSPGRVNLKSITILHTDYAEPSEPVYMSPPACYIDSWESLSELMMLTQNICLKLEMKLKGNLLVNLFDFWYNNLESLFGEVPPDNWVAYVTQGSTRAA